MLETSILLCNIEKNFGEGGMATPSLKCRHMGHGTSIACQGLDNRFRSQHYLNVFTFYHWSN